MARQHFDEEVVAFLDQQVELVVALAQELREVLLAEPLGKNLDVEVGIDLEHLARREHRLVDAELIGAGAQPVQVGQ